MSCLDLAYPCHKNEFYISLLIGDKLVVLIEGVIYHYINNNKISCYHRSNK